MKGIVIWILLGALGGVAAASFIVPPMIIWYNESGYLSQGNQPAAMVNLPDVMRYATTKLVRFQGIGAAIGAVVFFALGLAFGGRKRRSGGSAAASAPQRVP